MKTKLMKKNDLDAIEFLCLFFAIFSGIGTTVYMDEI